MLKTTRRRFLSASAALAAAGAVGPISSSAKGAEAGSPFKTKFRKALIGGPTKATFESWKAAGFDGMEASAWNTSPEQAAEAKKTADACGFRIHSVLRGWTNFNNEKSLAGDIESVKTALKAAQGYGAGDILLVPCRIGGMAMPQPWEFDIDFDEKTGHVKAVVKGNNAPYAEYIAAHNQAVDATRKAVEQLIPTAEETGVVIGIENVWNNLWVKPAIFANFIRSFDSPWLQGYFDIGNHVKYAPSEEWIRTLGKLIVRCHVKDFKLNDNGQGGRFVDIRDGSVNWPVVMQELDKLGKDEMWMSIEGSGGLSVEERSRRLDTILAGK